MITNFLTSLVVLNYNDYETTSIFLEKANLCCSIDKIIVVDNHSTDDSFEKLKKFENIKITVIQTDKNGGYGYGNNYGIKYALNKYNSEYVIISNPDVFFENKTIDRMLEVLENSQDAIGVAPIMANKDGILSEETAWKIPSALNYILSAEILMNKLFKFDKYENLLCNLEGIKDVDCVAGSFFMVRAKEFSDIGMFDEKMFLYCEETCIGLKFKAVGRCFKLIMNEKYLHIHGETIKKSISSARKRQNLIWSNRKYLLKNYYKVNEGVLVFADIFYKFCTLEYSLFSILKGLMSK